MKVFKNVYKSYTNFSIQCIKNPFTNNFDFGKKNIYKMPKTFVIENCDPKKFIDYKKVENGKEKKIIFLNFHPKNNPEQILEKVKEFVGI